MGHGDFKKEPSDEDGSEQYVVLMKDKKTICRTRCKKPPGKMPGVWSVLTFVRQRSVEFLCGSPFFFLECAPENVAQRQEWGKFMTFLQKHEKRRASLQAMMIYPIGQWTAMMKSS